MSSLIELLERKHKRAIHCLYFQCNWFLRYAPKWEQPMPGARAKEWFCCKEHFLIHAAMNGQEIRPWKGAQSQFTDLLERVQDERISRI